MFIAKPASRLFNNGCIYPETVASQQHSYSPYLHSFVTVSSYIVSLMYTQFTSRFKFTFRIQTLNPILLIGFFNYPTISMKALLCCN